MIYILVVSMVIGAHDFERREYFDTQGECMKRAGEEMTEMLRLHPDLEKLGVGCVIDRGDPA